MNLILLHKRENVMLFKSKNKAVFVITKGISGDFEELILRRMQLFTKQDDTVIYKEE